MAKLRFLLLRALLICITTTPPSAASFDMAAICDKAADKAFCIGFLNLTRAYKPSMDIGGAGKIALDLSLRAAGETRRYIKYLAGQATSGDQGRYKTCIALYGDAGKSISKAKASFAFDDYDSANVYAGAAQSYADTCDEELAGLGSDDKVHEMHRLLFDVLDVVLVVTNKLLTGG